MQPNARTVQGVLEDAIERATGERSRAAFAGRTDSGVHARGQVASFLSATRLEADVLQRALNAWLPGDLGVCGATEAPGTLDVRRDALRRHYRYLIEDTPFKPVLERGRAWHVTGGLDVAAMAAAARGIIGRHDFAAFAGPMERAEASTVRDIFCFEVCRAESRVMLDVAGNAFLPHQIRRITGALVEVGRGKLTPDAFVGLLAGPPASAGPAAPAHGLYLMRVEYEAALFGGTLDSSIRFC